MSKRFSDRILTFLHRPGYRPMMAGHLARAMGVAEAEYGDFHDAVDALRRVGRVLLGTGSAVMLPHPQGQVVGTFRANPRGFGFVVPDEATVHGDLYIPAGASLDALTGDKVLCRVVSRGKREGKKAFGGQVLRIVERGNSQFVGQLRREGGITFVQPDGNALHTPILIDDAGATSARAGDQVVVEIIRYPSEGRPAKGVVVERLGRHGRPRVDLLSVIRQFHLPDAFPEKVLPEARRAVRSFDVDAALAQREDLSGLTIITIDPDDAKDYDDAISLEPVRAAGTAKRRKKRGAGKVGVAVWELGVHIADVSAFVARGGALDEEAESRGTSVYFPGHVVPMLPEVLSNGVCSLQEGEARLCKSAFIQYDARGRVVGTRFANTVIRSTKRLTYRQATAIVEGRKGRHRKAVVELVERMATLARTIQQRRLVDGALVLDLPEVKLILDDKGEVIDAEPADTSFSHTIIEMFMVEANEAVARLLKGVGVAFLRRVHAEPDASSLESMARFLRAAGLAVPSDLSSKGLQGLLASLRGRPEAYAVNLAVLKSLQLAEYSPADTGHYALASRCYTHFTSPIRRYTDLTIHRLLELYLCGRLKGKGRGRPTGAPDEDAVADLGRRMSYLSRRAESAERELKAVKILQLLAKHVGDTFEGVVTGVTNFGLFVQHPRYLIDGLLRYEDLGDDWWDVDVKAGRVVGERTRRRLAMGSRVKVQIMEVDGPARQLNLSFAADGDRRGKPRAGGGKKRPRKGPVKKASVRKGRAHGGRRGSRGRRG